MELTKAECDVLDERRRQHEVEGWTPEHDDQHKNGEIPRAAGLYAISAGFASKYLEGETKTCPVPDGWPWADKWWKPANARRDLVKAGALNLDLGGAIAEKLAYNAQRADHKPEARAAAGGKTY